MNEWQPIAEYFKNDYFNEATRVAECSRRRTGFDNLDGEGKFKDAGQQQIFMPGIYIVGAPPSAGKTTFTLQLLSQLADRGEECAFLSYEMSTQSLCRKLISRRLFEKKQDGEDVTLLTNANILRAGENSDDIKSVVEELADTFNHLRILHTDWESATLVKKLRNFTATLEKPPVIAIDYLQTVPMRGNETAKEKLDSLLSDIRKIQVDTGATVILISSFNRGNNMKDEATFSSFLGSAGLEYTADTLWVIEPAIKDTETMVAADKRERQKKVRAMRLRCLKNREGGLYEVFFRYHAAYDTFEACRKDEVFDEDKDDDDRPRFEK